jgi:hypothetical protein
MDVPVVFLDPGLNGAAGLLSVNLTTSVGHTTCLESRVPSHPSHAEEYWMFRGLAQCKLDHICRAHCTHLESRVPSHPSHAEENWMFLGGRPTDLMLCMDITAHATEGCADEGKKGNKRSFLQGWGGLEAHPICWSL